MNNTPNINLSTYTSDPNDKFNLLVTFNNNMTKIDTAVGAQNDAIDVIEETAGTAVTTANIASATAEEALQTAGIKASIDDTVASTTTTYSSDKIDDLISGIQPGTEIDDSVTSTTKTWSSSKINTEIDAVNVVPYYVSGITVSGNLAVQSRPDRPNELILTLDTDLTVQEEGYYLPILYIQSNVNTTANTMNIDINYDGYKIITMARTSFPDGFSRDNVHTVTAQPTYFKTTDSINAEVDITKFTDSTNKSAPNLVWIELRKMSTRSI